MSKKGSDLQIDNALSSSHPPTPTLFLSNHNAGSSSCIDSLQRASPQWSSFFTRHSCCSPSRQNNCAIGKFKVFVLKTHKKNIKRMRETVNHFKVCFNDCLSVSETHSHILSMQTAQSPDTHIFHTLYL